MDNLVIDPEFKNLIPPLTSEERQQLEQNLVDEGCRDALVIWDDIIVDGHNRYEICKKHNIGFEVSEKHFVDREEAKIWIKKNQLGRRNIPIYLKGEYKMDINAWEELKRQAKENVSKGVAESNRHRGETPISTDSEKLGNPKFDTTKKLADDIGVGYNTASQIIQIKKHAPEELKEKLRCGEVSVNKAYDIIKQKSKSKEEPPVMQPDTQEETREEEKENAPVVEPEPQERLDVFSISYFEQIVTQFICNINPLSFGKVMFAEMDEQDKLKYLEKLGEIKKRIEQIENIIKK